MGKAAPTEFFRRLLLKSITNTKGTRRLSSQGRDTSTSQRLTPRTTATKTTRASSLFLPGYYGLSITYCWLFAAVSTTSLSSAFAPQIFPSHRLSPSATKAYSTSKASAPTTIANPGQKAVSSISMPFPYVFDGDRSVPSSELPSWMLPQRTRVLTETETVSNGKAKGKDDDCVVYWMQRDVRTVDNWGLLLAQHLAQEKGLPLRVVHVLASPSPLPDTGGEDDETSSEDDTPPPLESLRTTERHGKFLLGGLKCVHDELKQKNVPFDVVHHTSETPEDESNAYVLEKFVNVHKPSVVVCDTSVLRNPRRWNESPSFRDALDAMGVPLYQVDAHNVVPIWYASPKREVGARTLRSKLHKVVDECLQNKDYKKGLIPDFVGNEHVNLSKAMEKEASKDFDYDSHVRFLEWDDSVKSVLREKPGTEAGIKKFEAFTKTGLRHFSMLRNDPNNDLVCSSLSPWFNHGHLSFATCMRILKGHNRDAEGKASFVEEGFVRRELSDNFLWYAPDTYDTLEAGAQWAQDSLELHRHDPREYIYSLREFERAKTHDDLWNAAQLQVVRTGKMHGFLRMYWAKKILEWTSSPADALRYAQYFNDKYALDGRDPNGFCGVAWSIFGNHDMGWKEREIFGKIRFMNYNGCKRKFKVDQFVKKHPPAAKNAMKAAVNKEVASRTIHRNQIAIANTPAVPASSTSSDSEAEQTPKRRKTTLNKARKRQKTSASADDSEDEVEDLSGLSKSAASRKTVKVLKAYIQSKGVSIKDDNGKPLLKAGLVDALMSMS